MHVPAQQVNEIPVHRVERDIRNWSHNFLEVPNAKLNGLPPCPYAKQAWLDDKVTFSINTGIDGLIRAVKAVSYTHLTLPTKA